jgi:hypothetical protein
MNFCTKLYEKSYSGLDILKLLENNKFPEFKDIIDLHFKLNFGRVKKNKLNFNFLIKTYSKKDLYHNIKINLKFDINFLNFLVLNKENIFLKKR